MLNEQSTGEVSQADRDLAALIMEMAAAKAIPTEKTVRDRVRGKLHDGYHIVQILTRHRLASTPPPSDEARAREVLAREQIADEGFGAGNILEGRSAIVDSDTAIRAMLAFAHPAQAGENAR